MESMPQKGKFFKAMKKIFLSVTATLCVCLCLVSCEKENADTPTNKTNTTTNKWWLFYATWDEWGHKSANCGGWGLCNFDSCWTCDVADRPSKHKGKVLYDDQTGEGTMTIELEPTEDQQIEAINWKLPFAVDSDIINPNAILYKGMYEFNPNVGRYGGYILNIKITK